MVADLIRGTVRANLGIQTGGKLTIRDFLGLYGAACFLPTIAGQYAGKNLVLCGDAACVWDDLEGFGCRSVGTGRGAVWKSGWHFMTVNKLVETFPGDIEHAFSNEPNTLKRFIDARRVEYRREFNMPQETHSITPGCKWTWPWGGHGTSGLGACLTAVALGYDRIVLCGMPLDNSAHNGEPHWRKCHFTTSEAAANVQTGINQHWKNARDAGFDGKVRSMSGRTLDWLGNAIEWA